MDDSALVSLLEKWGPSTTAEESDINTKMMHLDPMLAPKQQELLRAYRRSLERPERIARATLYKSLGTAQFTKEAWRIALVAYLAGVWMLRDGDPPCPKLLANHLCELEDVAAALGPAMTPPAPDSPSATGTATDESLSTSLPPSPPPQRLDERAALRTALLMNVAAAALKLSEWRLARTACEAVLAVEPRHPKAMWRVAKAHEGDNNLSEAINVATKLVRSDASNAEASKLLVHLQKRKAKYGKMFNSFVERAHAEGDTLYTKREHERDVSDAMQKGFIQCMGRVSELCDVHSGRCQGHLGSVAVSVLSARLPAILWQCLRPRLASAASQSALLRRRRPNVLILRLLPLPRAANARGGRGHSKAP